MKQVLASYKITWKQWFSESIKIKTNTNLHAKLASEQIFYLAPTTIRITRTTAAAAAAVTANQKHTKFLEITLNCWLCGLSRCDYLLAVTVVRLFLLPFYYCWLCYRSLPPLARPARSTKTTKQKLHTNARAQFRQNYCGFWWNAACKIY